MTTSTLAFTTLAALGALTLTTVTATGCGGHTALAPKGPNKPPPPPPPKTTDAATEPAPDDPPVVDILDTCVRPVPLLSAWLVVARKQDRLADEINHGLHTVMTLHGDGLFQDAADAAMVLARDGDAAAGLALAVRALVMEAAGTEGDDRTRFCSCARQGLVEIESAAPDLRIVAQGYYRQGAAWCTPTATVAEVAR